MDQQPLVGEDFGDDAADALQAIVGVAQVARQDHEARTGARRLEQHQPVVAAHHRPHAAELLLQPALAGHVGVVVVEAHPRQVVQGLQRAATVDQFGQGVDRVGDAAELARDDAGKIGNLLADQQVGLAARQVGQRMAGRQLELDVHQVLAQAREVAGNEGRHRLASGQPHDAAYRVGERGGPAIDRERRLLHRLHVAQKFLTGRGQHEAIG